MDDSKRGLNLVGTTVANIKNELLSLAGIIQNQLIPGSNQFAVSMQAATANFAGTRGGPTATNVIANNGAPGTPRDTSGIQAGGNNNNIIGSRALTGAAAFGGGAMAFGGFISSVMPSAATAVRQDLLTAQSAFYGQGGFGGSLQQQSANVRALQNALARRGTAINAMDTTNALAMAQSLGLSGASNFNQVMTGIATASNFAPGIGLAGGNGVPGAVQVMGTMNAPATVNMLKTVGINVRGPNGEIMPLPQIVERLWGLITQNGRIPISEADIQTSLIPGNGLYGMLISLYGNDQMTFTLVSNMLLAKARSGGKALASMSKAQLQSMGLTTATVNKMANQTAAQTGLLTATASATAAGYGLSADLGAALNNFATAAGPLTQALGSFAGGYSGTMGLGNSAMGGAIKTGLASLAGANIGKAGGPWGAGIGAILGALFLGREKGGPTDSNTPYIVGEKGPELFIPKTDGVVIPNGIFRQSGGGQRSTGALSNTELRNILEGAGFAGDALTNAMAVARAESGGRPGALNPTVSTGDYSMGLFQVNMISY